VRFAYQGYVFSRTRTSGKNDLVEIIPYIVPYDLRTVLTFDQKEDLTKVMGYPRIISMIGDSDDMLCQVLNLLNPAEKANVIEAMGGTQHIAAKINNHILASFPFIIFIESKEESTLLKLL
jgi:hypothetical protein